jgi:transcriptional regulator with XRE-family HTH domain
MMSTGRSLYAKELRRAREALGMTRDQLAAAINFSRSLIEKVEAGTVPPSPEFTAAVSRVLRDGIDVATHFERIREHSREQTAVPDWVRTWFDMEPHATRLRSFELSVVPGLLQIEEYAAAQLHGDREKVAVRLGRQQILDRERPPSYVAVIDERVLRYPVGGSAVMTKQLAHLCAMAERFVIQVLPADCGTYDHLDGAFAMATVDGRDYLFCDVPAWGVMVEDPAIVSTMNERWEAIRAEALPRRQSVELIQRMAEQWT